VSVVLFFWHTFFYDYSREFVLYNETGTDISLIMSYHQKFHHQNKKQLLVCSFSLASSSDVMSIFRRQQGFAGRSVYYFNSQISFFADLLGNLATPWSVCAAVVNGEHT